MRRDQNGNCVTGSFYLQSENQKPKHFSFDFDTNQDWDNKSDVDESQETTDKHFLDFENRSIFSY